MHLSLQLSIFYIWYSWLRKTCRFDVHRTQVARQEYTSGLGGRSLKHSFCSRGMWSTNERWEAGTAGRCSGALGPPSCCLWCLPSQGLRAKGHVLNGPSPIPFPVSQNFPWGSLAQVRKASLKELQGLSQLTDLEMSENRTWAEAWLAPESTRYDHTFLEPTPLDSVFYTYLWSDRIWEADLSYNLFAGCKEDPVLPVFPSSFLWLH